MSSGTWQYRYSVLTFAVIANFSQVGARLVISPILPDIVAGFQVSKSEVGIVLTGMWMAFALMQYPSGIIADRYGERRIIRISLFLTAVCSLLLWWAPSFYLFGLAAIFLGAGAGLYFAAGTSLLTKLYKHTGQALGIHSAGAPLAGLVIPILAVSIATRFGWRQAFLIGAITAFGMFLLISWRVAPTTPSRPDEPLRQQFRPAAIRHLLGRRSVVFVIVIAFICMFTYQSFVSFFPIFLIEYRAVSAETASILFTVVFVLSAACQPLVGRLSDFTTRDLTLLATIGLLIVGFGLTLYSSGWQVLLVGLIVLGIGFAFPGVLNSLIMENFHEAEQGAGFGLTRTAFVFPGALGNVVTGTLADNFGWAVAFSVVMALAAVGVSILLINRILRLKLHQPAPT